MKEVALEHLVAHTILTFCENKEELGCPLNETLSGWFCSLSEKEMYNIADKLLDIMDKPKKKKGNK